MPPTTGSGSPAATETGPPEVAGYQVASAPTHEDAQTRTFEGRETASRRRVLVQVARSSADLAVVQRLRHEAGLLRSLSHPNILGLHPGTAPIGTDALILEHVPGLTLAERMTDPSRGPLEWNQACRMATDVAAALNYAQEQGTVHGDVRPENILLPPRGSVRLTGFGAEPPAGADARTDVYGLAATVYYALTGTVPSYRFPAAREEGGGGWLYTLTNAAPFRAPALTRPDGAPATGATLDDYLISPRERRPDLPPGAAEVIRQGLAARAEDRYASAGLFAAALQAAGEGHPAPVPVPVVSRVGLWRPVALAGGLGLLVAGVWIGLGERHPPVASSSAVPAPARAATEKRARPRASRVARALPLAPPVAPAEMPEALGPDALSITPRPDYGPFALPAPRVRATDRRRHPRTASARRNAKKIARGSKVVSGKPPSRPSPPNASENVAWLRISARQAVNAAAARPLTADVRAEQVYLDSRPLPELAEGGWVRVTPGPHRLAFYPPAGGPFAPNLNLHVNIEARSRRHIQVPLPRRVAHDTVVDGLAHFGDAPGIMKPGAEGGPSRGNDTDDNSTTPPGRRRGGR